MTGWTEVVNAQWTTDDALQCSTSGSMQLGDSGYTRSPCFPVAAATAYNFGFMAKASATAALSCAVYWFIDAACTTNASVARSDFFNNTTAGTWGSVSSSLTTPADVSWANVFCVRNGGSGGGDVDMVFLKVGSGPF